MELAARWTQHWTSRAWLVASVLTSDGRTTCETEYPPVPTSDATTLEHRLRASSAEAECVPASHPVVFRRETILPPTSDPNKLTVTSQILAHPTPGGPVVYTVMPEEGAIAILKECPDNCQSELYRDGLVAPVRVVPIDFDQDQDEDLLVADIGLLPARRDLVGRVLWLESTGNSADFSPHVLLDGIGRVACAEPADLDGDMDIDVAVCEFGAADGSFLWLEQTSSGAFVPHSLKKAAGAIHAFPFDADGDSDIDLGVAFSQSTQQVLLYRGDGRGAFNEEVLFTAESENFGLGGIELVDLENDGDMDILILAGDYMDDSYDLQTQGLYWLENNGSGRFDLHEIVRSVGAYAVKAVDMDGDCDKDLVLASLVAPEILDLRAVKHTPLQWLENDGSQHFTSHEIKDVPSHLVSLEVLFHAGGPSLLLGSFATTTSIASARHLELLRHLR